MCSRSADPGDCQQDYRCVTDGAGSDIAYWSSWLWGYEYQGQWNTEADSQIQELCEKDWKTRSYLYRGTVLCQRTE